MQACRGDCVLACRLRQKIGASDEGVSISKREHDPVQDSDAFVPPDRVMPMGCSDNLSPIHSSSMEKMHSNSGALAGTHVPISVS